MSIFNAKKIAMDVQQVTDKKKVEHKTINVTKQSKTKIDHFRRSDRSHTREVLALKIL